MTCICAYNPSVMGRVGQACYSCYTRDIVKTIFSAYKHFRTHILYKNLSITHKIFQNEFLCKYLECAEDPSVQFCILHLFQFYKFCGSQKNLTHTAGFPYIKYSVNILRCVNHIPYVPEYRTTPHTIFNSEENIYTQYV